MLTTAGDLADWCPKTRDAVLQRVQAGPKDGVELDMRFPEHFWIERERKERCCECRKRLSMCSDTSA